MAQNLFPKSPSSEKSLLLSELGGLLQADTLSMDLIEANGREGRSGLVACNR